MQFASLSEVQTVRGRILNKQSRAVPMLHLQSSTPALLLLHEVKESQHQQQ